MPITATTPANEAAAAPAAGADRADAENAGTTRALAPDAARAARRADAPFARLNDAQRAAVEHGAGAAPTAPLLVIAGAGSGKTMTLAARVARLVRDGADPQRLLLLSFSRRAAEALARRAGALLRTAIGLPADAPALRLPWAGTFHGVGARLLREYAGVIGLPEDFTILDRADAEELLAIERQRLGLAATQRRFPTASTALAIYSRVVNAMNELDAVVRDAFAWCSGWEPELRRLFAAYVGAKQRQHLLDYDDLLLYWQQMVAEPALAAAIGARFDHVLVDEYQDTNRLQAAILLALKPDGRGLAVVGDDAQSIYSFRAAEVRNILDFPLAFPTPARVVALQRNYRSTQQLLDASNALIAEAAERHAKTLWSDRQGERAQLVRLADDAAQARWVADQVLLRREGGSTLKQQAVLFRTAHHSAALELELARRDIPFVKFGGLKFLEAAHVKDLLAVLRFVDNPRGELAGHRVARLLPGMGPAHARRLLDAIAVADDPRQALRRFDPPPPAAMPWRDWLRAHDALLASQDWPADVEIALRWYRPHLERLHDDAALRAADLETLARIAAQYPNRRRFLAELTLDPPQATSDEAGEPQRDEDYLILSTIHSAKGQEWSAVYVLNVVDGCIPSDLGTGSMAEIDEERRLLYVAMTRAKHHLALIAPQRFYVTHQTRGGDRHLYAGPSRFLTPAVRACFDEPPLAAEATERAGEAVAAPAVDLAARVRRRF